MDFVYAKNICGMNDKNTIITNNDKMLYYNDEMSYVNKLRMKTEQPLFILYIHSANLLNIKSHKANKHFFK